MFQYPVTEIYSATGERTCVFSTEEHAAKLAEGWLEERPAPTIFAFGEPVSFPLVKGEEFEIDPPMLPAKRRKGK